MSAEILLDPSIRDWVLIPLALITLFLGLARHYATIAMTSKPEPKLTSAKNAATAEYARLLLANGTYLSPDGFKQRAERYTNHVLTRKVEALQMDQMMDPGMMSGMMKNNFIVMLPNIGMMTLVSHFFSGFVVAKVPFHLTSRLRGMMQRGVDIDRLDVNYVASLSLYFMVMFGLQGVTSLIVGGKTEGADTQMMSQMGMGQQQAGQPVDYSKIFPQLKEELEFSLDRYSWKLASAPTALLTCE